MTTCGRDPRRARRLVSLVLYGALVGSGFATPAFAQDERIPLTIEEAVELAREHHPQLAVERANLSTATARQKQAFAGYLPGLTGDFTYAPQTPNYAPSPGVQRVLDAIGAPGADTVVDASGRIVTVECIPPRGDKGQVDHRVCGHAPPLYLPPPTYAIHSFWTASIGLSWVLFDWGKTYYANRSASAAVDAQAMTVTATAAQIVLNAKLAFFDVLTGEASVAVAEEEAEARRRHLETARGLHDVGRNTRIDVASAESALAAAELIRVRAHAAVDIARAALAAALGDDEIRPYAPVPPPIPTPPAALDREVSEAADRRPEVRELSLRARSASDAAKSARGAYLPQIQFQIGPWWSGPSLDRLVTNVGGILSLTYPGSTGMNPVLISGRADEAASQSEALMAEERTMHNALRLEAERTRTQLYAAHDGARAAKAFVSAARERRDQAEARYREGVGTFLELSDAELEYANARFEEVRSRYDIGRAQSELDRALARP